MSGYTTDSVLTLTFNFEDGMTFSEWIASEYATMTGVYPAEHFVSVDPDAEYDFPAWTVTLSAPDEIYFSGDELYVVINGAEWQTSVDNPNAIIAAQGTYTIYP